MTREEIRIQTIAQLERISGMLGSMGEKKDWTEYAIRALEQEPREGHWKLVQRGKEVDICCSKCEATRVKGYAYNYTIDQIKEDLKEYLKNDDMRYCPYCGSDNSEVEE